MVYGILKSKSIVLSEITHSLNEVILLKKINTHHYTNLMRIPDINERHNLIRLDLSYMREKWKVFTIDDTDVMKSYGKAFEGMGRVRDASYPSESPLNMIVGIKSLLSQDYLVKRNNQSHFMIMFIHLTN